MNITRKKISVFSYIALCLMIISILPPILAVVNGTLVSNVTANYGFGSNASVCFDNFYYYIFFVTNTKTLDYAYSVTPTIASSWTIITIATLSDSVSTIPFGISCGDNHQNIPTYIGYAQFGTVSCVGTIPIYYRTISGSIMSAQQTIGTVQASCNIQASYINSINIIHFNYQNFFPTTVISIDHTLAQCNSENVILFTSTNFSNVWNTTQPFTAGRNSVCQAIPQSLTLINNLPSIVFDCLAGCIAPQNNNGLYYDSFFNGGWNSAVLDPTVATYSSGISTLLPDNITLTVIGSRIQSFTAITEIISFNVPQNTWRTPTVVYSVPSGNSVFPFHPTIDDTKLIRLFYFSGQNINYFYPSNETIANIHQVYTTNGDTIDATAGITVNSNSIGHNFLFPYFVSSTTPKTLKWAQLNQAPLIQTTKTEIVTYAQPTNASNAIVNQVTAFITYLFGVLVILFLSLWLGKKMELSDTGKGMMFILITIGVTVIGLLDLYIGVFVVIVSLIGLLSERALR